MKKIIILCAIILPLSLSAQDWFANGTLNNGIQGNLLGTYNNYPINIYTNNINTARFSTGNTLGTGSLIPGIGLGDGLRIMPRTNNCGSPSYPSGSTSSVDIWTSCSDGTNIRWDGSGQISGTNNRFEIWANYMGLFFNTASGSGVYKFARTGTVTAFVGTNNFWRIGQQTDLANISGNRRLEVADDNWQLRLSRTNGSQYTDFQSNANGNLQILPQGGSVGVNLNANPTANLDVNGNARIRNVQAATPNSILVGVNANGSSDVNVSRLDFTGNANQVLLGNGTWGTAPSNVTADNGVSRPLGTGPVQLGDVYDVFTFTNTPLTLNRQIRLNGKSLIFSGSGNIGIGLSHPTLPTEVLDVNGNVRFRAVPSQGGQSLILGLQNGVSADDVELSRLAFPNDNTQVLLGDGTWGTASTGGTGVGNYCSSTSNPLTTSYELPLNDFNYRFTGNGGNRSNFVGIGHACSDPLEAKLDVLQMGYWRYHFSPTSGVDFAYAGKFVASTPTAHGGIGVIGVSNTPGVNYGVCGNAGGGTENWAGYFTGNVYISGTYGPSDKNLKRNIEDYKNANDILSKLRPTSYSFRTDEFPQLNLDERPQIGLISQEVEEVFPTAVKETTSLPKFNDEGELEHDAVTFKAVSYEKFIPILIGGHQEQQSEIESLKRENEELKNQVNQLNEKMDVLIRCLQDKIPDLCKIEQGMIRQNQGNEEQIRTIIDVELKNGTAIVLNQNVPNPFAESTVITFSIPENVTDAQIIFHDATGSLIKSVDIRERANGQINVYASDLSAGAYTYSLVADGKIVATKRMVKQ